MIRSLLLYYWKHDTMMSSKTFRYIDTISHPPDNQEQNKNKTRMSSEIKADRFEWKWKYFSDGDLMGFDSEIKSF